MALPQAICGSGSLLSSSQKTYDEEGMFSHEDIRCLVGSLSKKESHEMKESPREHAMRWKKIVGHGRKIKSVDAKAPPVSLDVDRSILLIWRILCSSPIDIILNNSRNLQANGGFNLSHLEVATLRPVPFSIVEARRELLFRAYKWKTRLALWP